MQRAIAHVALVVRDYDEALAWYTGMLGFSVVEDSPREAGKRWVLVRPSPGSSTTLLLARAAGPEQLARVGTQTGGRVFLFLHTDDFWRDYQDFRGRGVRFTEEPREESYGTVAVFQDLYGNRWDLIQPNAPEQEYRVVPVGWVRSTLTSVAQAPLQGNEGAPEAWVEIAPQYRRALSGIREGDSLVLLTWLHLGDRSALQVHPRSDPANPLAGVFATRSPDRPNPIGLHPVRVLQVEAGRLRVGPLEAIDGTPVIDIKVSL